MKTHMHRHTHTHTHTHIHTSTHVHMGILRSLGNKLTITQLEFYASECYTGVVEEAVNFHPDFKEK